MHSASKVLMGHSKSSVKEVSVHEVNPATFLAGLCVSRASTGLPSLTASAGMRMGVSLGKSLSDTLKTAVLRSGEGVPVLATLKRASGIITITSYANLVSGTDDAISVAGVAFTAQVGAVVAGAGTFQAATSNADTAQSLANQINAHATAGAKVYAVAASALVKLYSIVPGVGSTGTGNDIAVTYTDNDTNIGATLSGLSGGKLSGGSDLYSGIDYATLGTKMYIHNTTGKADVFMNGFSAVSDAMYVEAPVLGIQEDGSEAAAVCVDMPGGL